MCGIWFYLKRSLQKLDDFKIDRLRRSFNKIKNRGPDFSEFKKISYNNSIRAIVGFHRLAIMDTSSIANQPFVSINGLYEIYVVCNGEIYNHLELIRDHNLHPKSHSDCEVILELYKKYRDVDKITSLLNGEFAFIIWERNLELKKTSLFAATDPVSVRPLFIGYQDNEFDHPDIIFSSEMKGLECCNRVERFKPGHIYKLSYNEKEIERVHYEKAFYVEYYPYYEFNYPQLSPKQFGQTNTEVYFEDLGIYEEIVNRLSNAVKKRIQSDRPIGCLLSGGLDSSLVACLLAKHMREIDFRKQINFFSIGNSDAPDIVNAIKVFDHIRTTINPNIKHHIYDITFAEALQTIPEVIKAIDTYDITTIRASTWQYLLAKKISETTDVKVILNGDGADEIEMGYQYFKNAPNPEEAQKETEKLLKEIHLYDGLRVDRAISYHGLEARVPFLDVEFFDYYMKIPAKLKMPFKGMEKYLIRRAFEVIMPNLLCSEVLWRPKEAFSDGISKKTKSWFEIIQDYVEEIITDQEYMNESYRYAHLRPVSKESYWYRKVFENYYPNRDNVISHYWLPNWCGNIQEPSARVLTVYKQ